MTNFNFTKSINTNNIYSQTKCIDLGFESSKLTFLFSGKTAISLVLNSFRKEGILKSKTDRILVPDWMGSWIYMTIHKNCFPVTKVDKNIKGVFVYHQWGFPQKIDKILEYTKNSNIFCIEDCAHSFDSTFNNQRLGTFGDASIFSFSKFFPSVVGGAVYSKNKNIHYDALENQKNEDYNLINEVFLQRAKFDDLPESKIDRLKVERDYAIYDSLISCPQYSLEVVEKQILDGALKRRKINYLSYRNEFKNFRYLDELLSEEINPWILPIFLTDKKNIEIAQILNKNNIESGVYNFDINRNLLNPKFVKCVVFPCHQGISNDQMCKIIDLIKSKI